MISVEELFKSNKYPKWISSNPVFSKIEYVRKIFPAIGLPNFEEKTVVNNTKEITTFANQLLDVLADSIAERTHKLEAFAKKAKIGKKRQQNLDFLLCVMRRLNDQLRNNKALFITPCPNGKISLAIPQELSHKGVVFMKQGAGLFKIYEKLNSLLKENKFLALPELSQTYQFKNFSSINIPAKETIIKFSSEGADGAWDIATMSMRGVNSCQTWDQGVGGNSLKIVGSIIDPFTAIIYLTTGGTFNQYGSKMVRRCVVRYVIEQNSKEPFLLLEKMYPAFDQPSLDCFVKAIKDRAPNITVYYSAHIGERATYTGSKLANVYIPLSDELKMLEYKYYPYCDSALQFREDSNCKLAKNTEALHVLFKKKIPSLFQKAIQSKAFTKVNVKKYGVDASKLMAELRGKKPATEKLHQKKISDKKSTTAEIQTVRQEQISVADLSTRFAEFVCKQTEDSDPFHYLAEHEKECETFFISEFGNKKNKAFAEFVASNVFNYIDEKSK